MINHTNGQGQILKKTKKLEQQFTWLPSVFCLNKSLCTSWLVFFFLKHNNRTLLGIYYQKIVLFLEVLDLYLLFVLIHQNIFLLLKPDVCGMLSTISHCFFPIYCASNETECFSCKHKPLRNAPSHTVLIIQGQEEKPKSFQHAQVSVRDVSLAKPMLEKSKL